MYAQLKTLTERPEAFSVYTAETLWTEPHLAEQMLQTHLSQDTALASRPIAAVERVVGWLDDVFGLAGKRVCDLGCGPGLYANRYAARGASVHGLDFSRNSIAHAQRHAPSGGGTLTYDVANYLTDPLPNSQDLVTLIYCDLCPLSPAQRQTLLGKIHQSLVSGGAFVFDVASMEAFEAVREDTQFGHNLMGGFWSAQDYFAFHNTLRYDREALSLDRFTIIEAARTWEVFNWLQYFSPATIRAELEQAGFAAVEIVGGFDADSDSTASFGVIAKRA